MPTLSTSILSRAEVERFVRNGLGSQELSHTSTSPHGEISSFEAPELPQRSELRVLASEQISIETTMKSSPMSLLDLIPDLIRAGAGGCSVELALRTRPHRAPDTWCSAGIGLWGSGPDSQVRYSLRVVPGERSAAFADPAVRAELYNRVLEALGLSADLAAHVTKEGLTQVDGPRGERFQYMKDPLSPYLKNRDVKWSDWQFDNDPRSHSLFVCAFGSPGELIRRAQAAVAVIGLPLQGELSFSCLAENYDDVRGVARESSLSVPFRLTYFATPGHQSIERLPEQEERAYAFSPFVLVPGGNGLVTLLHHGDGNYQVEAVYDELALDPDAAVALFERLFERGGVVLNVV